MPVNTDANKNFWLIGHGDTRFRQIRRALINFTDDPLTDREETIGLLCEEIETLTAEVKCEERRYEKADDMIHELSKRAEKAEAEVERLIVVNALLFKVNANLSKENK